MVAGLSTPSGLLHGRVFMAKKELLAVAFSYPHTQGHPSLPATVSIPGATLASGLYLNVKRNAEREAFEKNAKQNTSRKSDGVTEQNPKQNSKSAARITQPQLK